MGKIDVLKKQQNQFDSMKVDVEIKNKPQPIWSTFLMAIATFMLAFIAFSQYVIEMRPKVYISQISKGGPLPATIKYSLHNSGGGTAYNVILEFDSEVKLYDKESNLLAKEPEHIKSKVMSHLYPQQTKISVMGFDIKKENVYSLELEIEYKINYQGQLFFFKRNNYQESGTIGYNPQTDSWIMKPD